MRSGGQGHDKRLSLRHALPRAAFIAGALLCVALAGPAQASATATVAIVNEAQPGELSSVPQPSVTLTERGSCATPFTAVNADGAPSPCPAGTWPGPTFDESDPPDWGPPVQYAGGDTLRLTFSGPMDHAEISGTTISRVGLQTPDGQRVRNVDQIPTQSLTPTADPTVWTFRLEKPLPDILLSVESIIGTDEDGPHDFAVSIAGPRWDDYHSADTYCGTAWWGSAHYLDGVLCPSMGPPPPPPPHSSPSAALSTVGTPANRPTGATGPATTKAAAPTVQLRSASLVDGRVLRVHAKTTGVGTLRLAVRLGGHSLVSATRTVHAAGDLTVRMRLHHAQARRVLAGPSRLRVQVGAALTSSLGKSRVSRRIVVLVRTHP